METITYRITVPVAKKWATGTWRGTGVVGFDVDEEHTLMGALRATKEAGRLADAKRYTVIDGVEFGIKPEPDETWPLGLPEA